MPWSQTSAWISSHRSRHGSTSADVGCRRPRALVEGPRDHAHPPVDGHPGHHLRVHEVAARPPHLPDALVGLGPHRADVLDEEAGQVPQSARGRRCGGRSVLDHLGRGSGCWRPAACRASRRRRRAGTARWPRCRCAPAPSPRSRAASRASSSVRRRVTGDAVHDLQLVGAAGDGPAQPLGSTRRPRARSRRRAGRAA